MELPTARQPVEEKRGKEEEEESEWWQTLHLWHLLYYYTRFGRTWFHII